MRIKYWFLVVLANVLAVFVLLAAAEGAAYMLYRYSPDSLLEVARDFYLGQDRYEMSYMESCARYDSQTSYTLRPGQCRFANREYDTTVLANSAGFRDDEKSLRAPEIIALGDSQTAGWGVEQDQAYASLVEKVTGLTVLNTGIPSFGTARELLSLQKVPTLEHVKYFTVQYCDNDIRENTLFVAHKGNLPIMRQQDYQATQHRRQQRKKQYYPGRFLLEYLPFVKTQLRKNKEVTTDAQKREFAHKAVDLFLKSLELKKEILAGHPILVFEINSYNNDMGYFTDALRIRKERGLPAWLDMEILDLSEKLSPANYYRLDDHMKPDGHQIVANEISAWIKKHESENADPAGGIPTRS